MHLGFRIERQGLVKATVRPPGAGCRSASASRRCDKHNKTITGEQSTKTLAVRFHCGVPNSVKTTGRIELNRQKHIRIAVMALVVGAQACAKRSSSIEFPPIFSEAPHLRSPIPHPNTDFSQNQIASRRILPCPKNTKTSFSKQNWPSDDFGLRSTVIQNKKGENVLPLSERVLTHVPEFLAG